MLLSYNYSDIINTNTCSCPGGKENSTMKEEYILKITELLERCNDIQLLDLIHQLLQKSQEL
jgi:hypothetical protein